MNLILESLHVVLVGALVSKAPDTDPVSSHSESYVGVRPFGYAETLYKFAYWLNHASPMLSISFFHFSDYEFGLLFLSDKTTQLHL